MGEERGDCDNQRGGDGAHVWHQSISLSDPKTLIVVIAVAGLLAGILALNAAGYALYSAGRSDGKSESALVQVHDAVGSDITEKRLTLQALIRIEAKIDAQGANNVKRK